MTTFLRRSSCLYRLTRSALEVSKSTNHFVPSPRYLGPLSSPLYRRYASTGPEGSSRRKQTKGRKHDEKDKSHSANGNEVAKERSELPSPPKPFSSEGTPPDLSYIETDRALKSKNSRDGKQQQNQDHQKELEKKAEPAPDLSPEDEAALTQILLMLKTGMPPSQGKDIDRAFEMMKKQGLLPEIKEAMEMIRSGKVMDLATVARLARAASFLSRKIGEEQVKSQIHTEQPKQKAGAHDPGPQSKEDRNRQASKGFPKISELKFDIGNIVMSTVGTLLLYWFISPGENSKEITWQDFRTNFLDKGLVEKVIVLNGHRAKVYLDRQAVSQVYSDSPAANANFYYYFTIGSVESFERKLEEAQSELAIPASERVPVAYQDEVSWVGTLLSFGPTLLLIGSVFWLSRRAASGTGGQSGIFGMGRSRAKRFNHETDIRVKFMDVAGMDEAKQEIMEFVSFLKEPGIYQKLGAKIPRGAILSGPPGTGKTLLAKATAGESQVPFFSVSGSEFVEMFVGVGASRVRDLFSTARKNAPCIIFIDEIDAIGKSRSKQTFGGGNDEREATLNQILTEMDGFNTSDQVVVLAGTNRPDVLDKALMRPGRFDRHIGLDKPTMEGRKQIFAVHLHKIVTTEDIEFLRGRLAALTPGFSGADIANTVNEAALIAARDQAESVKMIHFERAIERVIGGLEKKSLVLSPEEKRTVAYHEAGHAICGWYFRYADPLLKVSIIPRGQGALGYAQYLPAGDTYLMNVNQLMDRMAMTLGGRVSEELHFSTVTSGASDDFNKVTRMATAMVTKWGMSRKIGYLYFEDDSSQQLHKPFSEETAKNIDAEVRRIVDEAYKQCRDLLTEKKKQVGMVAEELLRKEALTRDDLVRVLGPRPYKDNEDFSKYFDGASRGNTGVGAGTGGSPSTPGGESSSPPTPPSPPGLPPAPVASTTSLR